MIEESKQGIVMSEIIDTPLEKFMKIQSDKNLHQNNAFLKILMGKYFIQGYRVFKMIPKDSTMILYKKNSHKTHYILCLICQNLEYLCQNHPILIGKENNVLQNLKISLQKVFRKTLQNLVVNISLVDDMKNFIFSSWIEYQKLAQIQDPRYLEKYFKDAMNPSTLQRNSQNSAQVQQNIKVDNFVPKNNKNNEQILFQSKKQFDQLKDLISTYIDTFANQQKANHLYKQMQKSLVSFSVETLLNTLNYIIYEQVNSNIYTQIQSSYWTCFEAKTKKLYQDRKHLVLSGNGKICVLELIFMKEMKSETNLQKKMEYNDMMDEFKKYYKKAYIKIYRITNYEWEGQISQINLDEDSKNNKISNKKVPILYKFDSTVVCQYPRNS